MPKLVIITDNAAQEITFSQGASIREALDAADIKVRHGCRGNGACGLCLVQVEAGDVNEPTKNEQLLLTPEQLKGNFRFACQLKPENDILIRIINVASQSRWRDLTQNYLSCAPSRFQPAGSGYGLAIDLGTTNISISLLDLTQGRRLSGRIGMNPQSYYGADVVTRLIAAGESPDNAKKLAHMPIIAIGQELRDLCSREGFSPRQITRVAITGNTAMLALLTETDSTLLLQPHYWTLPVECRPKDPEILVNIMGIHPQAALEVIPPFAGFVGSDLLAGVLATRLTEHTEKGLLIDFGTNSEIALWDDDTLWVTSAAGGPAFEGCGIQCGMPAEPGAIYRFDSRNGSRRLHFQVTGGGEARGICGSGLVDLIAILRSAGELTATGKFSSPHHREGFVVQKICPAIGLTKGDIDIFQRAKGAVGVGIKTLLANAHMNVADLSRICVCGAFGRRLNIQNARLIGLLPETEPERVELCGNTSLAGCELILLNPEAAAGIETLRKRATIINLAEVSDFETLFLENLYLQPMEGR